MKNKFYLLIFFLTFLSNIAAAQTIDLFFLNQNGANRFILKDQGGVNQWTGSMETIAPTAVNGFDIVIAEDFNGDGCKDLFLLNTNGANRFILKEDGGAGSWNDTVSYHFDEMTVNGYDFVIAEDFNGDDIKDLFFLNQNGANRFILKDQGGVNQWTGSMETIAPTAVNGFDIVIAEDFNGDGRKDLFLLKNDGTNRFVLKEDGGAGSWDENVSYHFDDMTVNGYDFVIAEDFNECIISGVNSIAKENLKLKIFPNPTTDGINIKIESNINSDINFSIVDFTGRRILEFSPMQLNYNLQSHNFPLSELQNGIYLLEYRVEEKVGFQKFVVMK